MYTCRSGIFIAAVLAAGCSGSIDSPYKPGGMGSGSSNGTGSTPGMGTGSTNGSGSGSGLPTGAGGSSNTAGSNGNPTGSGGTGTSGSGSSGAAGPTCQPGVPGTSQLPRLTNLQYENTIRDLFEISAAPSSVLAPDSVGAVDERTWQGYKDAAEAVATQVMGDAAAKDRVFACTTQDAACMDQVINDFGQRAFRRPLSAEEKGRFRALFDDAANITETGSWDEISKVILKSFLMSPSFLMRAETASQAPDPNDTSRFPLTSYEVASRLSYMLWDTMPDVDLFAAAAADSLTTSADILAQARRMLQSEKARSKVASFHQAYMHMGAGTRWVDVQRDAERYQDFTADMIPLLTESTAKFFDSMVFDSGASFQQLLLTPKAFVNAKLAPLYGLPAGDFGTDLELADVDAGRPGVFTQVGFLAVNSAFARTSPILRGAFLQKEVLCTQFGSPPDNAQSAPVPTGGQTNRENMDNMTAAPDCIGCHHTFINPTGFALESFDPVGAWQTEELDTGAAIDTNAVVMIGEKEVPVTGAADLMTAIANSPEAQRCYAKKWVQFAYERSATAQDACTVDNMTAKLTAGGYTVLDLITDLTQSDSFRIRAQEVAQ